MTALDGGPLRRIQLQDRYRLRVSKGRGDGGDPDMYSKTDHAMRLAYRRAG